MNKRKKITIIIYLSIIIVNLTMFIVGYVNYLYPKLGDYHVLGVNASNNLLLLTKPLYSFFYEREDK